MMANRNADQNPLMLNPSTRLSTNKIIKTPIRNPTKPNVRILNGRVIIRNMKPIVAFTMASNTPTTIAVHKPSTLTHGTT